MDRTKVKSSHLKSVGYDAATRTLEVEFKGGEVYQYDDVSPQKFRAFANSGSLGAYLAERIKPQHEAHKL